MKKNLWVISIFITFVFLANISFAQMDMNFSRDENIFQTIDPPPMPSRQPAEFEPMESVLIRYPFGISYEIIAEMAEDVEVFTIVASTSQQTSVESQYQSHGVNLDHCSFLIAPSDSYWTRDYGPWFIFNGDNTQGVVDFEYNRPRPNDNAIPSAYATDQGLLLYDMPLDHTGGNYMTDGEGISISTDLVWTENPGLSHSEISQIMFDYLGIHTYHVVPDVNGEYIEHIDCWAKYLSPDTIMIREVSPSHSQYDEIEEAVDYFESQLSCWGTHYVVERVYTPNNEPYTNSLILNDKVLVPITGSEWDDEAIESYETAMPGYEILGFTGSWQSTDALHCRAKEIPDRYMLYISHIPILGNQSYSENGYTINSRIVPYSGEDVIEESTLLYWRVLCGQWNVIQMEPERGDGYTATIPPQEIGTTVSYYVHSEDYSARTANHPYIGASDPHFFVVSDGSNNPPEKPSTPEGPSSGKPGVKYMYTTDTEDPEINEVFYMWDWGDDNFSEWLGQYESGETCTASHTWDEKGTYSIRVKAKDIYGEESDWSDPLEVRMPRIFTIWDIIEMNFPRMYSILSMILGT